MHLDENDVAEFAQIWLEEFGEALSKEHARHHAKQLMELYLLLAEPPPIDGRPLTDELTPPNP